MAEVEFVILVDQYDNILGKKSRLELTDKDCWRAVCIWIENSAGQVLLQQRSPHKSLDAGYWSPAAVGTVIYGDTYHDTAIRELEEEIGVHDVELHKCGQLHYKSSLGYRQLKAYRATCDWPLSAFKLQAEEVAQVVWIDKAALLSELTGQTKPTRQYTSSSRLWPTLFWNKPISVTPK